MKAKSKKCNVTIKSNSTCLQIFGTEDCLDQFAEMENLSLDDKTHLHPIARTILQGVHDKESPFSKLNSIPHVLQMIWRHILWDLKLKKWKNNNIKYGGEWYYKGRDYGGSGGPICNGLIEIKAIEFPQPNDININMMPFFMCAHFGSACLPDNLKEYHEKILENIDYGDQEGQIGYLTIHESLVEEGTSQRRPGLHTESPGVIYVKKENDANVDKSCGLKGGGSAQVYPMMVDWGRGGFDSDLNLTGGIFIASSVDDSCEVWDCQIVADESGEEIIRKHGDIEHVRSLLPESKKLKANTLYWITDRTPHESLSLKKGTYRQFIRVVTNEVSVWYKEHSTENPFGIPPGDGTIVVKGSKFDGDVLTIVD